MKAILLFSAILTWGLLGGPAPAQAQFIYTTNDATITITGYTGPGGEVIIPSTLDGLPVTTIGDFAFSERDLTSVTIPNSVTRIGNSAFTVCTNLASINIGNNVTNIGAKAFASCPSLTGVTIPNSVIAIGDFAFSRCYGLTNVIIGNRVVSIGEGAFYLCAGLTNIVIPDSVTLIDDWAFSGCAYLTAVTLGNHIAEIEDWAFSHCFSLTSVSIPDSVERIGSKAFISCYSLTNVTIGNGITEIEERAFSHCYTLISVTIGTRLTRIGDWAFFLCAALKSVYFSGDAPAFRSSGLFAGAESATIYFLPGTSGWGSTFDGFPTALWSLPEPAMLNFGAGFGVQTNGFGFVISWATNVPVVIESSTSMTGEAWSPVATNTLKNGSLHFTDPAWKDRPAGFYRVRAR
jgi:hypothetical protein